MIGDPDIILVWPKGKSAPDYVTSEGYSASPLGPVEDDIWMTIHRLAVPSFATADLHGWLSRYRNLALQEQSKHD